MSSQSSTFIDRASVVGKFIHIGGRRSLVRGVSYGTFAPDAEGFQFPVLERIAQDFALMHRFHINTVRVYTRPRVDLLDEAARHELRVMIGLAWPQHLAFLDDRQLCREIRRSVRQTVAELADHPATLLFALGNEIPPDVVRWFGAPRIERFLRELYDEAKSAAPESLFAYVNYPPTDYLDTSCFDLAAFNVYLHRESDLRGYLARLQHMAGDKPLLLTEAGADRFREGEDHQAALTAMQLRAAFAEGAAGAIAFTWTDEWWRGGHQIEDWAFGLVDANRRPKSALHATSRVFSSAPFSAAERRDWPTVSVVVCAYNAADTLDECLTSLEQLIYPHFEIIVVNDGSRDATGEIARRHAVTLIESANGGLSSARNLGLTKATGEIVAYTDADVRADPDWLTYLVQPFLESSMVGSGGPNVPPTDDPWLAHCIALSPGGPAHVLIDDRTAEHVPGCNMAFRREALLSIGGFDARYHAAGDDVDVCWRLQARGYRIGFSPAALVWHHRRPTVRAYWRQQVGYGQAEAWLMKHHREKFLDGRALWRGRIYAPLPFIRSMSQTRVNTGVWGTAPFPSVYSTQARSIAVMPHSPEWQVISVLLLVLGGLFVPASQPLLRQSLFAAGGLGLTFTLVRCLLCGWRTNLDAVPTIKLLPKRMSRAVYRLTIAWLHLLQPMARTWGQVRGRMSPSPVSPPAQPVRPSRRAAGSFVSNAARGMGSLAGVPRRMSYWSEQWVDRSALLTQIVDAIRGRGIGRMVEVDDGWQSHRDASVSVGHWAWLDLRALVEDHGSGKTLVRVTSRVRSTTMGVVVAVFWALILAASTDGSRFMRAFIPLVSILLALRLLRNLGRTEAAVQACIERTVLQLGAMTLPAKPAARALRIDHLPVPAETRSLPSPLTGQTPMPVHEPLHIAPARAASTTSSWSQRRASAE